MQKANSIISSVETIIDQSRIVDYRERNNVRQIKMTKYIEYSMDIQNSNN